MKRSLIVLMALALVSVLAVVTPAGANHKVPITITVQSTYAGLCNAKPGPNVADMPPGWGEALAANAGGTAADNIPWDLWKTGPAGLPLHNVSGKCDYGTDSLWNVTGREGIRGSAGCNNVTRSEGLGACRGLHYPGVGPPVQPGRFLNFSSDFLATLPADPKNFCRFVSTGTPNSGECAAAAIGYVNAVSATGTGGYCGTSKGPVFWAMAATNKEMNANPAFLVAQWEPTSAGSILLIQGSTTGPNWTFKPPHFLGFDGTPGTSSYTFLGERNVFVLVSARSYIMGVDTTAQGPGTCGGALDAGGVQFFNQSVAVALGN